MRKHCYVPTVLALAAFVSACDAASVNEDLRVSAADGRTGGAMTLNGDVFVEPNTVAETSDFSTVNGDIEIADRARVQSVRAVNGDITLGKGAHARSIESVNGRVKLGPDAQLGRGVKLVNGGVSLDTGVLVRGSVATVNGEIVARGATIEGDVENYEGGMQILDGSVVKGSLTVHEPETRSDGTPPRIVIGADSRVVGPLKFERDVRLYVHETAEIGPVEGAEPVRFSGATPEAS
jgi:NDP-sugar pyrophosphorylase family protein